jgi:parallel beta-helix repeat protein
LLLFSLHVEAATYTVKAGGGGNFTTIQQCANAMAPGDTCVVYAGTYNEHVTLPAGGAGSYKTLQINGTDVVYVYDFTISSHNKIIGFHIQNPSSPSTKDCIGIANAATDIYITGNTFYACGYHAMISGSAAAYASTYVYIQNNTFSYPCSTSTSPNVCKALNIVGDYHLIENNDISHTSDGMSLSGSHNIIRKNLFHDNTTADCGSLSSNCHIDFIESEPSTPTQYNVYEANTELRNVGQNGHGYLAQGDVCGGQCSNLIIRFNVGAHVGSGGILDDNALNGSVPGFSYVKSYNNTWVDYNSYSGNQLYGGTNGFTHNSTNGAEINDLFYYPESLADFNPYSTDASSVPFSPSNNLAWCTGSPCNLHGHVYSSGSFTDDPGNIKADPMFANYAGDDFGLLVGSPALGAGTYLTRVAAGDSGSGASLVVNDASFFQDGYGITGVNADCLAVTTVANQVCITAANYQTNTLTLATSVTRTSGDPVWLYLDSTGRQVLFGKAPNIGATFHPPSPPAPPTSLTADPY